LQLCEASRGPPSHFRIPREWPLPSGDNGEPLWCCCPIQEPIRSKWKTTIRNIWWTVTNQTMKPWQFYHWQ
jgi:hypothetical protein